MDGRIRKPGPDPGVLLRVSEHFLLRRHYEDCRRYAHQAQQINHNFPGVTEILAVADVLLAAKPRTSTGTLPDWYKIMQVDRYSQDAYQIRQKFYYLYGILNPSNNKFPFADEAFDTLRNAWFVLSHPLKKLEYDDLLKKLLNDDENLNGNRDDFAFWTVCPYCYYVYEYPRVYLGCCLRCANEKCSKVFTCVEFDRPSVEVIKDGKYICTGFLPVGFQNANWNQYVPLSKEQVNVNGSDDAGKFVEISDDDDDDDSGGEIKSDKSANVGLEAEVDTTIMTQNVGRKKSIAKKMKKVTRVGIRVTKEGFLGMEEMDMIGRSADNEDDGCENGFSCGDIGGAMDLMDFGGVEFYDADDDLLVSLQNDS